MTSPGTAPRRPPSWPRRWCTTACARSRPGPTRWTSSAASTPRPRRFPSGCSPPRVMSKSRPRSRTSRRSPQDEKIGELIAEAFSKVGKDGVITVEESPTMGLELEFTEGLQFDKGYISPYFITDPERLEAVLED